MLLSGPLAAQSVAAADAAESEPVRSFLIGGELRERFESWHGAAFGLSTAVPDDYLLHRATLFVDLRRGEALRGLVEIVGGFTSGWPGSPPPTQNDPLDLLQAYIEPSVALERGRVAVRAGRQELSFGSSRLVSSRESPNIRRAFDGARAIWTRGEGRSLNVFFVRPVIPADGTFDDASSADQRFWGAYATRPIGGLEAAGIDAYYLGLDRADAVFAQGQERERRNTVGMRVFGARAGWDWNVEGAWQWGSFGDSSIRAWTLSVDAGFELAGVRMTPRVGLKVDAISGDRDLSDAEIGTFNPLFPKLPYFSEANLATPANLFDVQPSARLALGDRVTFALGWDRLRKHEEADAFYAPPLTPVDGTSLTQTRHIGWQTSALVEWQVNSELELAATYVRFEPHSVVRQAGGRDGSFFGAWIQWSF
jgi:hypothetical protein